MTWPEGWTESVRRGWDRVGEDRDWRFEVDHHRGAVSASGLSLAAEPCAWAVGIFVQEEP
jgi:hypothetical protein